MHRISDDRVVPMHYHGVASQGKRSFRGNRGYPAADKCAPKSTGLHEVSEMHVCIRGRL